MKRISLKFKLTLLYTFFMALLTCAALAILFSLSSREILSSTQNKLEQRVQNSVDDLDYKDGELQVDSDFYSVNRDVYLSLYDSDMYFLYGKVPYGFNQSPEISDGETRTIRDGNKEWYVYDMSFRLTSDYTAVRADPFAVDGTGDSVHRIPFYPKDTPAGPADHKDSSEDTVRRGSFQADRPS